MIKCLIIEDEIAGQLILEKKLSKFFPTINVLAKIDNVNEAVAFLENNSIDLLFLDVEIKGGTGLDVISRLNDNVNFEIIYITAYAEYAIKAINLKASYYMVKPIQDDELIKGVNGVLESILDKNNGLGMFVSGNNGLSLIKYADIFYMTSDGAYTKIMTSTGVVLSSKNLGKLEKELPENIFFRCHHSYLVNLTKINSFIPGRSGALILKNNQEIPVAQRRMNELKEKFKN